MKKTLLIALTLVTFFGITQITSLKSVKPDKEYENIFVKAYASDEFQSSYIIWVKNGVRLHKHNHHTENLYVIEGKGELTVDDEIFVIKKGDYINIPKNTPHGLIVLSSKPMKVLSIQSPKFTGVDRIFLDE